MRTPQPQTANRNPLLLPALSRTDHLCRTFHGVDNLDYQFAPRVSTHEMMTQLLKMHSVTSLQLSNMQVGGRRAVGGVAR